MDNVRTTLALNTILKTNTPSLFYSLKSAMDNDPTKSPISRPDKLIGTTLCSTIYLSNNQQSRVTTQHFRAISRRINLARLLHAKEHVRKVHHDPSFTPSGLPAEERPAPIREDTDDETLSITGSFREVLTREFTTSFNEPKQLFSEAAPGFNLLGSRSQGSRAHITTPSKMREGSRQVGDQLASSVTHRAGRSLYRHPTDHHSARQKSLLRQPATTDKTSQSLTLDPILLLSRGRLRSLPIFPELTDEEQAGLPGINTSNHTQSIYVASPKIQVQMAKYTSYEYLEILRSRTLKVNLKLAWSPILRFPRLVRLKICEHELSKVNVEKNDSCKSHPTLPRESGASGALKSRAAPLLLPALDRSRLQRSPCTIPRSAPSNLQSPPTCSPARAQDMAQNWVAGDRGIDHEKLLGQPQSENQILLPFHLLTNSILKPLDNTSNNTRNPALTLLDFIPKPSTPSSPSSTRPSSSSWAKFLILRQLESLRDFLQLTSLIGGLCHSNSSSTPSPPQIVISKLPLFRRVFAGKGAAHESLRTYCLLVFRWIPGVLSLDFAAYSALSPVTSAGYGCLLTLLLCEFYRVTNGAGRRPAFAQLKHAEGLDQTTQDSRDPSSDTTNTHWTGQTNELVHKQVPVTRICLEALVWANVYWSIPNVYIANADHPTTDVAEKLRSWTGEALVRPAEFCYRTTVRKDTPDAAGLVLFLAVLGLLALGCWFLLRLVNTIRASCPRTLPSPLNNTTNNKTGYQWPGAFRTVRIQALFSRFSRHCPGALTFEETLRYSYS
ncbi:hypothetical protein PtB15_11B216 [Puccinia triticina]|nr:hypothetical protein PtB15_11B216 [Puccinia triticina]